MIIPSPLVKVIQTEAAAAGILLIRADDPRLSPAERGTVVGLLRKLTASAMSHPLAARDVPAGQPWPFPHRSLAEVGLEGTGCERELEERG